MTTTSLQVSRHVRQQLRPLFSSLATRLGTLTGLSRKTPVAILAEAFGYTAATLDKHAAISGGGCGRYISELSRAWHASGVVLNSVSWSAT